MAKVREPGSLEDALEQAIGFVGADELGHWIGVSGDLVRKFSDHDQRAHHIQLRDALVIDAGLVKRGFPAVFCQVAQHNVIAALPATNDAAPPPPHVEVSRIVCDAARCLDDFVKADHDKTIDWPERCRLLADTGALQKRIAAFRRGLFVKPPSAPAPAEPPRTRKARASRR